MSFTPNATPAPSAAAPSFRRRAGICVRLEKPAEPVPNHGSRRIGERVSVRVETDPSHPGLWPKSGGARKPLVMRVGEKLRRVSDRVIAASSLIPDDPVLDVRAFPWTAALRANWREIRDEAVAVAPAIDASRAQSGAWLSFALHGCPRTAALVAAIPNLNSAFFSILAPGMHIPAHSGVTKGLITCHLGLIVTRDGDARMRLGDRIVRWAEGETLVFDDTQRHEIWNDTNTPFIILRLQIARPLRQPGRWLADIVLGRGSPSSG